MVTRLARAASKLTPTLGTYVKRPSSCVKGDHLEESGMARPGESELLALITRLDPLILIEMVGF
jgi:hypothetical protein